MKKKMSQILVCSSWNWTLVNPGSMSDAVLDFYATNTYHLGKRKVPGEHLLWHLETFIPLETEANA